MKEIQAFIRATKVNETKEALAAAGFPAFFARKCLGRGKQVLEPDTVSLVLGTGELPRTKEGESMTEPIRLLPRRFISLVVEDDMADLAIKTIIDANQTGNPGDGRIFVADIKDTYVVRTGKAGL
ncbi:MAG: P-II family nitrogen regulator [Clostridiales Family XIII bacterium]|jgi:nitrogen regulatory protein PII 2|nr:P-II family nitrogen regulator [Clostridiales Family XIII bacterium]